MNVATKSISRHRRSASSRSESTWRTEEHTMAFTHLIRSSMSHPVAARARAGIVAGIALSVVAGLGCSTEQLTANTDPDILNVEDYNTPAGATPLRIGVIGN